MSTIPAELLLNIRGAAQAAQKQSAPFTINPTHLLAILDRLKDAEDEDEKEETFDELSEIDKLETVMGWLKTAHTSTKAIIADEVVPGGVIQLEIKSLGHASDEIAAEKLEEWLNTMGLDSAAQQLGLVSCTSGAGTNQLYLYSNAA
ncbi:hypothetical protein [Hymenobacter metallilatus]|uniref:Uncharacterized protein n=1 Tax=Hymenobacter metallilatus TaxID=2493666 RepID=A0A3R9LWX4_9BACT|nr:hypothetical protein [Hymenobacter metallilatus]RSK29874.1 hypothetical protein EI290_16195 [Hymenobacter metallilatus]